jgi:hypothetical protein
MSLADRVGRTDDFICQLLTEQVAFGWIVAINRSLLRSQERSTAKRSRGANRASLMSPTRRSAHSPFRCLRSRLRANPKNQQHRFGHQTFPHIGRRIDRLE